MEAFMDRTTLRRGIVVMAALVASACAANDMTTSSASPTFERILTSEPSPDAVETVRAGSVATLHAFATETASSPTTTPTSSTTSTPDAPLSTTGPWIVFTASPIDQATQQYLWVVNPDGSGLTQFSDLYTYNFSVREVRGDNGEIQIAYTASTDRQLHDLSLHILTLPSRHDELIILLTSSETAFINQDPNDEQSNYWLVTSIGSAIVEPGSPEWSPDGKWLAFVGAMDGPTADVYSFEPDTGRIRHLTSGDEHAFQLLWSPDSRYILHTAKDGFEHSGGYYEPVSGTWAASPDGGQVLRLEQARPTKFLGWISSNTLVATRGGGYLSEYGLRMINIHTGVVTPLPPPCFSYLGYNLEENIYFVVITDTDLSFCTFREAWEPGGYLITEQGSIFIRDVPEDAYPFDWSPMLDMFIGRAMNGSWFGISRSGELTTELPSTIPPPNAMRLSDNSCWSWAERFSLFVSCEPDFVPKEILSGLEFEQRTDRVVWIP